jgi:hypothetical protein
VRKGRHALCRFGLGRSTLGSTLGRVGLVVAGAALLSGCGITHLQDLSFRVDNRLHFTTPKARTKLHQPVHLAWTIHGFRIAAAGSEPPSRSAGYFAVFVDRTPIKPGQTMKAVADGDPTCKRDPKCPDTSYLEQREIYTTTDLAMTLPQIPNVVGDKGKVQHHAVTVVLMDTSGHRIGESAWELDFRIPKVGFS